MELSVCRSRLGSSHAPEHTHAVCTQSPNPWAHKFGDVVTIHSIDHKQKLKSVGSWMHSIGGVVRRSSTVLAELGSHPSGIHPSLCIAAAAC